MSSLKNALRVLTEIRGLEKETRHKTTQVVNSQVIKVTLLAGLAGGEDLSSAPKRNLPLARHENESARKIADLYNDLVHDLDGSLF